MNIVSWIFYIECQHIHATYLWKSDFKDQIEVRNLSLFFQKIINLNCSNLINKLSYIVVYHLLRSFGIQNPYFKGVSRIYLYLVYFCILYSVNLKFFFFSSSFKFSHKCINIRIIYNTFFLFYEFYITSLSKRGIYCIFKVRSFFRLLLNYWCQIQEIQ